MASRWRCWQHSLTGEAQYRIAPGGVGAQVAVYVVDKAVDPVLPQGGRKAVPVVEALLRGRTVIHRSDGDEAREPLGMAKCVGGCGMGAHRVAHEEEPPLPHPGRHHPLQVGDELRISVAATHRCGVRVAVPAGVVGEDLVSGSLERARAMQDVPPRGCDPVTEDDGRPLSRDLPAQRWRAGDGERPLSGRHQEIEASAASRSSTVWNLEPVRETCR